MRTSGIVLDDRRLEMILAETPDRDRDAGQGDARSRLSPTRLQEPSALPADDPRFDSLDARYHAMLAQLLGRLVWSARIQFPRPKLQPDAGSAPWTP